MTPQGLHGDPDVVSKSRFAQLAHVSPARVSQWVADHKITGDALVGAGRSAQIRVSVACAQLKRSLDINQRLGNGVTTRLDIGVVDAPSSQPSPPGAAAASTPFPPAAPFDPIEDRLKREKLEQIQRANRRSAREEAEKIGRLTDSDQARRETARAVAQCIAIFEGAIPQIATALAERFQSPQRDIVHVLRREFRQARESAAKALRRDLEEVAPLATIDVEDVVSADATEAGATDVAIEPALN